MKSFTTVLLIALFIIWPFAAEAQQFAGRFRGYLSLYYVDSNVSELAPTDSLYVDFKVKDNGKTITLNDLINGIRRSMRASGRNKAITQITISYPNSGGFACTEKRIVSLKRSKRSMLILKYNQAVCDDGTYADIRWQGTWTLRR